MKKIYLLLIITILANYKTYAQAGFTKVVDPQNPITTFVTPGIYKGTSWIDFDNDNDLDLFAAPNLLFRNDNGTFVQITNPFGFTPLQNPGGSSWADLNADGWIDCIIAQYPSGVFLNNTDGTFNDISSQIPNFNGFPAWGCSIGDWNKDAYPDFVFAHASNFHPTGPFPSKLYLNTGSAVTPQNITGYTLTDSIKPYTVPYWSDYDMDGDMDLFVASGPGGAPGPDFSYKNLKVETGIDSLQRMTTELFATQMQDGQCYNFIDFDSDGDLDLCLTNYSGAQSKFYVNNGGNYTLQTMPFTNTTTNLSNDWGDFDNDGDQDVMITNDNVATKYFRNSGNGSFAPAVTLGTAGGSGISNGDYDNDGDLDVFILGNGPSRALFRNDSAATGNNWINIKCTGIVSNKSALGTFVKIKATINGNSYWQIREINAQNAFQSQNDLRVHFGLGNATIVDSLLIKYPSGNTQVFTNVPSNIFYCNDEGSGSLCLVTSLNETQYNSNEVNIYPNPVNNELNIELENTGKVEKLSITVIDMCGKIVQTRNTVTNGKSIKINTATLQAGEYLLKIENENYRYSKIFVKAIK